MTHSGFETRVSRSLYVTQSHRNRNLWNRHLRLPVSVSQQSRAVSQINGDFSRKSQIFLPAVTPCILRPAEGVPFQIGYRSSGTKNQNDGATWPRKKFDDIFSRRATVHERDRRTDRGTDRQQSTVKTTLTQIQVKLDNNFVVRSLSSEQNLSLAKKWKLRFYSSGLILSQVIDECIGNFQ